MEVLEKDKKDEKENKFPHKTGNFHELLKVGKNSNINIDISRLSCTGFSNLLEKAKKVQSLKKTEDKTNIEQKKEEFDTIYQKGKENLKKNNITLSKIPDNFEILRKFSMRMSNKKAINKDNNILNNTEIQGNIKDENYCGINTTANTNSNTNSNFNTEKTKTKESQDDTKKEKEKEKEDANFGNIRKTVTNNPNIEKRKYFH